MLAKGTLLLPEIIQAILSFIDLAIEVKGESVISVLKELGTDEHIENCTYQYSGNSDIVELARKIVSVLDKAESDAM